MGLGFAWGHFVRMFCEVREGSTRSAVVVAARDFKSPERSMLLSLVGVSPCFLLYLVLDVAASSLSL